MKRFMVWLNCKLNHKEHHGWTDEEFSLARFWSCSFCGREWTT